LRFERDNGSLGEEGYHVKAEKNREANLSTLTKLTQFHREWYFLSVLIRTKTRGAKPNKKKYLQHLKQIRR